MPILYQDKLINFLSEKFIIEPSKNFGDVISKSILEFFSKKKVMNENMFQFDNERKIVFRNGKLISIGSSFIFSRSDDYIWGTGCINTTSLGNSPRKIYAVRGPLTRDVLLKNNIECPEIYGDPAILYPELYNPQIKKTHKYGIIPHYIDFTDENILRKLEVLESKGVKIINITDNEKTFIDNLLSVEFVLSSSLHGIIMSDSYGIPNVKVVLSNKLVGGSFKFRDYFMSVNRAYSEHELPEDFTNFNISTLPYEIGDVSPLKENLLVHNPWNDPTFPYFEKNQKSFVYYCTENYLPIVTASVESIRKFSSTHIFVYTLNFEHDFNILNVKSVKWDCDIEELNTENFIKEGDNFFIKREEHKFYKILIQRPLIIKHALENFSELVCYVDSDSIATPWVDEIFNYFPNDSKYPYLTLGIYDFFSLNGRGISNPFSWEKTLEHPTCELLGVNQKVRKNYRQTGYILAGQHTTNFLQEWYDLSNTKEILENPSYYAPYHEETIVNVLFWKHNFHESLPLVYVNGSLKDLGEIFDNKNYNGINKNQIRNWFKLPEEKKYVHFVHGEKNVNVMMEMISEIEKIHNNKLKVLFLAPHLSTGGMPGFLLKRIESLKKYENHIEIFVVEYSNLSVDYVVQKNQIKNLIPKSNFFTLGQNKLELIDIIKNNNIDIVHIDDVIESLSIYRQTPKEIMNAVYSNDRTWRVVETAHNVSFKPEESKIFTPDGFAFCTPWHPQYQFNSIEAFNSVIEFPIENKVVSSEEKIMYQKQLNLDTNKKHVVNVGLWTRGKNQGEGVEIARLLEKTNPEIQFHFIGNQAPNFKNYWEPIMKNLPSNVKVWGERSDADVFIKACDVFLFNSTWECNPLVLREAISYGKPVLSRNLTEYLDMFTDFITPINDNIDETRITLLKSINQETNYSLMDDAFERFGTFHIEFYRQVMTNPFVQNEQYNQDVKIIQNYIAQPYFEIRGNSDSLFNVQFYDENNVCHFNSNLRAGNWVKLNRQYFTNWRVKVWQDGKVISNSNIDLNNKRVYIAFDSKSLGDTVAWIPYTLEFQKKHNCKVTVSTFWNHLFEDVYPEIEFIKPGQVCHNIYAMYKLGWFHNENMEPEKPNTIPLQKAATNILGLEYTEIQPRISFEKRTRPVEQKYVTIASNSTSGLKFWTKQGWQDVINFLSSQGYLVFNVSKEKNPFENAIQIKDTSIENTMRVIYHSEFFIGLSSGLSWLSWGMGKKVVMISNFTKPDHEFISNCIRITNPKVCNGCWNNPEFKFDRGDWNWCPLHKGTERHFECHTSITSDMVILKIKPLLLEGYTNFDWGWMDKTLKGKGHLYQITQETFIDRLYEKFFEVEPNDIVLDVGASVGPFTYSILGSNPKHVYCLEPSEQEFSTLVKNTRGYPVTPILKGITTNDGFVQSDYVYDNNKMMDGISFKKFVELHNLQKIDFLKTDCEGGEYDIFNEENFDYIINNVKKISGEWHLRSKDLNQKFRKFRDTYLKKFDKFYVYSVDGVNIKWDLWNEHFLNYYGEIIIHIDNRK
jgi:autotransporter strand-loop-strand O-heptosyltransferase